MRRLGRLASPSLQTEMAAWWEAAVVDPNDVFAGFSVADLRVLLHGVGPLERPWRSALPAEFHGRPQPELVRLLVRSFGDDADQWATYLGLAADFTGTVGELIDAVDAVTAGPAS